MDNNTEFKQIQELKYYTDNKYTHCDTCEKKCMKPEIVHFLFRQIIIFTFCPKKCEKLGCSKAVINKTIIITFMNELSFQKKRMKQNKRKWKRKKCVGRKEQEQKKSIKVN